MREGSIIKKVKDYVPIVQERFPELSEKEINRILLFGWRMYYYVNSRGCDVLIEDNVLHKFRAYTGFLQNDLLKRYQYSLRKWRLHDRMMYRLKRKEWDGYYYIGIRNDQLNSMEKQMASPTRQYITFTNAYCYKVLDEIKHDKAVDYIFRFKYPMDVGFKFYQKKLRVKASDLEFVGLNNK